MSIKKNTKNQPKKEDAPALKPRPFPHAANIAMLNLAGAILHGYEVHVMDAGERYAVLGDDAFTVVTVRDGIAKCIAHQECQCGQVVLQWRRRLRELGVQP